MGGAEANVVDSATALRQRGHENLLLHVESTGRETARCGEAFGRVEKAPGTVPGLLDQIRRLSPDAVWIHNWPDYEQLAGLASSGLPCARMFHDHASYCLRTYKYHPLTRHVCHRPASLACLFPCLAVIRRGRGRLPALDVGSLGRKFAEIRANRSLPQAVVASRYMRHELLGNGFDPARVTILPPVPPDNPLLRDAPDHPPSAPGSILFAGQIIRGKGLDVLLEAVARLTGAWTLEVAGEGNARTACEERVRQAGLSGRVTFHGHLAPPALAALYASAAIVAFPSMWPEPFGLSGIEAMRAARPVVGFDTGGVSDWLEHERTGLLVPWGDREALTGALARLIAEPELARHLGKTGLEVATDRFSFEGYTGRLESFLQSLPHPHPTAS